MFHNSTHIRPILWNILDIEPFVGAVFSENYFAEQCTAPGVFNVSATNCVEEHEEVTCNNPCVSNCICAVDPYCCEEEWDELCVEEVVVDVFGCVAGCSVPVTCVAGVCEYENDTVSGEVVAVCDCNGTSYIGGFCDASVCNAPGTFHSMKLLSFTQALSMQVIVYNHILKLVVATIPASKNAPANIYHNVVKVGMSYVQLLLMTIYSVVLVVVQLLKSA